MAISIKHYINGVEVYPVNGDDIGIKMNFSQDAQGNNVNELSVDSVILAREAKDLVLNHINNGVGLFQGIPYYIDIDGVIIDMFIDLTESPKISGVGDGTIEVKVKKRKSFEQFKEKADSLSFELINKTHPISVFDIPYVIIPDNQGASFISAAIGTFVLGQELKLSVLELGKSIQEFIEAVSIDVGVGVGATGPVAVTVFGKFGAILLAALKLAARIIYFIAVMLLFINMMNKMLSIISPLTHNLKGSTVLELISKGCIKLGYTFQSSILSNDFKNALTILPVPLIDTNQSIWQQSFYSSFSNSYNEGYPSANDTTPTLGSLIDAMITMFNGKIQVNNGVVKLERRDFWLNISSDTVINTLNIQGKRENKWTYNTGDAWKRYSIYFQTDFSDIHTLDNIDGLYSEFSTEPINVINTDLVNIKGLSDANIPFSFACRKDEVSLLEKEFKTLSIIVNAAGSIFGSSGSTTPTKSSLGVVKISQQHFSTTKLMYVTGGGKQGVNYRDEISALKLWNDYHHINEVNSNLKEIYNSSVPFSSQNISALQGNNYIYDTEGNLLEILNFEWNNEQKTANIEYAIETTTPSNTKTIQIKP